MAGVMGWTCHLQASMKGDRQQHRVKVKAAQVKGDKQQHRLKGQADG